MDKKPSQVLSAVGRVLIVALLLMFSVGLMKTGSYVSWFFCVALIVVVVLPEGRFPSLTRSFKRRLAAALAILMMISIPLRW